MRGAAKEEMFCGTFLLYILRMRRRRVHGFINVLSESFLYLPLWLIFRQPHPNFINVRTAYASEIWAQLTKNHLTKTSTERFREYIVFCKWCSLLFIVSFLKKKAMARIVEHIAKVAAVDRKKQNQPTSVISNIFLV